MKYITKKKFKSIWISDVHLGTHVCKADRLLDFLRSTTSDNLFLVGDIVDGWTGPRWFWSKTQSQILDSFRRILEKGVNVMFFPGNHDEANMEVVKALLYDIPQQDSLVYTSLKNEKYLIIHGHQFHHSWNPSRWLGSIGGRNYIRLLKLGDFFTREDVKPPNKFFLPIKSFLQRISNFRESSVLWYLKHNQIDAKNIISGHTHEPGVFKLRNGITVWNDGDWIVNCTAIVETCEGEIQLVKWE